MTRIASGIGRFACVCAATAWLANAAMAAEPLHIAATYPCAQALDEVVMQWSFEPPIPKPLVIATANRNLLDGYAKNRWPVIMRIATPDAPIAKNDLVIGRYVVRVIVNAKNPVATISRDQLADMMLEKIETWEGLGGSTRRIAYVGPPFESLTGHIINRYCQSNGRYPRQWIEKADTHEIVAAVQDDASAIGFILARADDDLGKLVRQLDVGDDPPTRCTDADVYANRWPLQVTICLRSSPTIPSLDGIGTFCRTPEGAEVLARYGIWPETNGARVLSEERLAEAKAGKGPAIKVAGRADGEAIMQSVATCFVEDEAPIQLVFRADNDSESQKRLEDREVDCLVSQVFAASDDAPTAGQKNANSPVEGVQLARHVSVVVVNRENPVESLSVDQLRDIYSGKTKDWWVPVSDQTAIQRFTLPARDNNAKLFLREILGGRAPRAVTQVKSSKELIEAVAMNPRALGVVNLLDVSDEDKEVRIVPLVRGDAAAVLPRDAGYFLERRWVLHVSPDAQAAARSLADFIARGMADRGLGSLGLVAPHSRAQGANGPVMK